jgi:NAD(P)-dependent dehydrogenase (short-subunit alcohol dehydrogenase family)/REP element-mobilizing transposase RayT
MQLNDLGRTVEACWHDLPVHYAHVELDAFIVMPNHVHGVLILMRETMFDHPDHELSEVIRALKSYSARRINELRQTPGVSVWQRSFYDHIVRDDRDLERVRAYIDGNPGNWQRDPDNPSSARVSARRPAGRGQVSDLSLRGATSGSIESTSRDGEGGIMGKLEGKVALVTGAGRGIGRGIALLMAQEGAAVVVNDLGASLDGQGRDVAVAQQVVDEIEVAGGRGLANTDSITDFEAVGAMVQNAIDTFGKLDIVVNVAGILRDRMLFNMDEGEWDAVVAVHLNGTFNTCRHASAHFRERREGGRIINFSSSSAWGSPGQPNYAAAKYGILGLTATLANSLDKYGVTSNAILPYAATRMIDSTPRAEKVREETGKLPSELAIGGEGDPANVAPMVCYLATDDAQMINGHFFGVGGYTVSLYSHWELAGVLQAERRWTADELIELFPATIGKHVIPPEAVTVPGSDRPLKGSAAMQAEESSWQEIADGVELWVRQNYYDAKRVTRDA